MNLDTLSAVWERDLDMEFSPSKCLANQVTQSRKRINVSMERSSKL